MNKKYINIFKEKNVFFFFFCQTFSIAGPVEGTVVDGAASSTNGQSVGDCITDQFR